MTLKVLFFEIAFLACRAEALINLKASIWPKQNFKGAYLVIKIKSSHHPHPGAACDYGSVSS